MSSSELYGCHFMPPQVTVDCLLPNGILVPLLCARESTLEQIKANLWKEARMYPLYKQLGHHSSYILMSLNQAAQLEEFYDETRRLCDLRLFKPIFKVVEPVGNTEEKKVAAEIRLAVGELLPDFDSMRDIEVAEMRRHLAECCITVMEQLESKSETERMALTYSADMEPNAGLSETLERRLLKHPLRVSILIENGDEAENHAYTFELNRDARPEDCVRETLLKRVKQTCHVKKSNMLRFAYQAQEHYLLKICGVEQYLLQQLPLLQYKYVRDCLMRSAVPQFMLCLKRRIFDNMPQSNFVLPSFIKRGMTMATPSKTISLLEIDASLRIKIHNASYVNVKDCDNIYVRVGLFHGPDALCPPRDSRPIHPSNPKWDDDLDFDLYMPNIPRATRVCVSICATSNRKKRDERIAVGWGNLALFDYRGMLLTGRINLYMWPVPRGMDALLNPLGSVGSNPYPQSTCLVLDFNRYKAPVRFPHISEIIQLSPRVTPQVDPTTRDQIMEIIQRDPLYEISEQEKDLLWSWRYLFLEELPDALPKLLDAVKWNDSVIVAELYRLLVKWQPVSPEKALELLDCKYADPTVRLHAVRWLDGSLSDKLLLQYLLQLVQVLKFEPYFDNPLARFLLRRSLLNYNIGHLFFWHLKSEMHDAAVRFGLILEAFCHGLGSHLKSIVKQVAALDKLTIITNSLKEKTNEPHRDRLKFLHDQFTQPDFRDALQYFRSPLNSSFLLGDLLVNECRILDSAKRPLWLMWRNADRFSNLMDKHEIIFKNGDDLRQDMLTLQVIGIMDCIWRNEGLDLRMMPYACVATGKQVGLIEVVRNAKTVMDIQKTGGRLSAFQVDSTQLYKWIKDKNRTTASLDQAVETFTASCAGYCVATFILGIGDRNPDNIMVNEQGQIFHIDFGHFLGHFKKKFGISRERVPFVLTEDFLYVISKGSDMPQKSVEFQEFQKKCGKAYVYLRRHASLLITLFTMMLSTGIPELQTIDDVSYLRKTLQVEKSEQEALNYFQTQFSDAYGGAWTTKLDWFFHSVKHL